MTFKSNARSFFPSLLLLLALLFALPGYAQDAAEAPEEPATPETVRNPAETPTQSRPEAIPEKDEADTPEEAPAETSPAPEDAAAGKDASILEEVVITGTRMESRIQDLPVDVTVIDQKRLRQPGMKNAFDALIDVAGVSINPRQDDGVLNSLDVRGLRSDLTSGGSVLILLDGIPQRRLSFGGPYMGAIPYDAVQRMELAKGPAASLYGRNALAGALQLFTDPGATTPHIDLSTSYEYPANSSHTALKSSGPVIGGKKHTYSLTGSFTKSEGWVEDSALTRGDLYANVNFYPGEKDHLRFIAGFYFNKQGMVAPVLLDENGERLLGIDRDDNLGIDGFNENTLYEYRLGALWMHEFTKKIKTNLTASYWHGDTYWINGVGGTAPAEGYDMRRLSTDADYIENGVFLEASAEFKYEAGSWLDGGVVLGGSFEYLSFKLSQYRVTLEDNLDENGDPDFGPGVELNILSFEEPPRSTWVYGDKTRRNTFEKNYGVFVRDQTTFIDRIHVAACVRYDYFDRLQKNPSTHDEAQFDDGAVSASTGLGFGIIQSGRHRLNLYGAWGIGFSPIFRSISNTEFAEVDPETSQSFEVGLKSDWLDRMISFKALFYQMERNDIVDYNNDTTMFENLGDWRIRGVEAEVGVRPIKELYVFLNYAWQDPVVTRYTIAPELEGHRIAGMSEHLVNGGVKGKGDVAGPAHALGGGTNLRYFSDSYTSPDNTCKLDAYVLWDAYFSYFYTELLEVSVFAKNLLDTEYFTAVYGNVGYDSGFEGAPRTFGAQLRLHF